MQKDRHVPWELGNGPFVHCPAAVPGVLLFGAVFARIGRVAFPSTFCAPVRSLVLYTCLDQCLDCCVAVWWTFLYIRLQKSEPSESLFDAVYVIAMTALCGECYLGAPNRLQDGIDDY
jgi:hypothetical protein